MVRALLCTAMILSLNFNLIGQIANQKEELIQHVRDHVKPGMTQNQIDSLYERAKANKVKRDENIKELVLSAQKANNNSNSYKSDACDLANWGFENGNIGNWATTGCVELQNGGIDTYSGFPKVFNGDYSLKLSNDMNYSCQTAAAARTYSVPASGQTFITIHFAVSIFNFPHVSFQAANFNFNLFDNQMNALPCPSYQAYYSYDQGPVGIPSLQQTPLPASSYNPMVAGDLFYNSNVSFSDWHHVTIDLTQYAGTDVTMVFENRWCAFDVDWIYTYIEVDCPVNNSLPVPVCLEDDDVELCAPQGMLATYNWEFNNVSLNNTNQCIMADNQGTYTLNFRPVYLECADTSYEMNFVLIDKPIANFSVDEFCIGQPININNLSEFGTNFKWLYNGQEITQNVPNLVYEDGEDNLTLIVLTGGCSDTIIKPLVAHMNPEPRFDFKNQCVGVPYKIVNLSTDIENGPLDVNWHISTDYQSTNWNPEYTPVNDEVFVISLEVTNQYGCSAGIQAKAQAYPLPIAKFYQSEDMLSENLAFVHFQDESSSDITSWEWLIGDQNVYNGSDFYHEFTAPGTYNVNLIVYNEYACSDTALNQILVNPSLTVFVPNTFTPNGDEINHLFYPVFSGSDIDRKNYSFLIYNRWGEVVFQTANIQDAWDGLHEGKPCMQGTYSWEIAYVESSSKSIRRIYGHVNLVR
jgi:gliding motility-associated-like protein